MYREDGLIPLIDKERFPRRLLVFDTEAYRGDLLNGVETQTYRLGVMRFIQLDKELNIIEDIKENNHDGQALYYAIERYARKDVSLYVYAHNIKYDLQLSGLLPVFLENGWKVSSFVFEDPPTFIRIRRNRTSIIFVDTFNYWQNSLAKMGEQLGLDKLKMPDETASLSDWYTYCERDVDVLTEYILSFMRYLKVNDLCGMGLTLASQSFRTYRHRFMDHIIVLHSRPEATLLERQAYSGGRVEAYHIGKLPEQTYYKLDVNSMYPFVMKEKLYPYEFIAYSEDIPMSKLRQLLRNYYVIGEVELYTQDPVYAYKDTHKLIFPIGEYTTVLHNPELTYALDNDHIRRVKRVAIYKAGDIFSQYIDFFYTMKVEAEEHHNPVIRHQAKIMMNSLYGKFGQLNVVSKIVENMTGVKYGRITGYSETLGKRVEINCLGDDMEVSYRDGEATYSFPAIAGAVTAYARMYLYHLMTTAGLSNVYYVDTDSLVVNDQGMEALKPYLDNIKLGMLKVEDISNEMIIWGAKDYRFGKDVKHKGVPKKAIEYFEGVWMYDQFRGAKNWLSDGLSPNVEVSKRVKARMSTYDKGIVHSMGNVSPVEIGIER